MDDLRAVMDAAGIDDAALWGASEGGPMSLLFAATYPERVRSLVLYGTAARLSCEPPSHPCGFTRPEIAAQCRRAPARAFRELSPGDHVGLDLGEQLTSEILRFVVGEQRVAPSSERVLATVLFTDIVSSTEAARCALDLVPALATRGIHVRAGVHLGECERRGEDWSGVSVHIGTRVAAMAGAGEVLVSRTVGELSGVLVIPPH